MVRRDYLVQLPAREKVLIDKDENFWRITYHVGAVILRASVTRTTDDDPDRLLLEASVDNKPEFCRLGECLLAVDDDTPVGADEMPELWRDEFFQLVQVWAEVSKLCTTGIALGTLREQHVH